MEVFMKKFALAGIAIFLALLFVTCDVPEFEDDADIEYTDVVYSPDGSTVTLYLDGVGVPVTKAQRALNKDLAMMGYDYLEAVFIHGSTSAGAIPPAAVAGMTVARAAWEIGQSAGISGVSRASPGINYAPTSASAVTTNNGAAIIFVGKKSDKTLLGIGALSHVDDVMLRSGTGTADTFDGGSFSAATNTILITPTTRSVTFTVQALLTHIGQKGSSANPVQTTTVTTTNSFLTAAGATATGATASKANATAANTMAQFNALGGTEYPIFNLPDPSAVGGSGINDGFSGDIAATFTISGSTYGTPPKYWTSIVQRTGIMYTKRYPRYVERGQYTDIKLQVDTKTVFEIMTHGGKGDLLTHAWPEVYSTATASNTNEIEMKFTTKTDSVGVFAFLFRLPVVALTIVPSTNGAEDATWWNIRPGFGGNLYNLDSGTDAGGAVLLSIGATSLDWIDIKLADPEPGEIYEM
jgi:hypothetical protein